MPFLFETLDDETELLLPDDLLTEHSIVHVFRTEITDDDCTEIEIIGWLYQFYISEKKDQVMARKSAVPTEDIPAVTQLFTPHWIVRYLVENSLGRLWLDSRPGSRLREHMPYYVDDPQGQPLAESLTVARPEDIRLLDPACGSGHMLTYTFDLLSRIYEEEGHAPSEIPEKILQHNLFGLEICPRATQLAQFALVCKAREKSRTAFRQSVPPKVICLEDVEFTGGELVTYIQRFNLRELFAEKVLLQVHQFRNASACGSLLQPVLKESEIITLKSELAQVNPADDFFLKETHRKIHRTLDQAEMLLQRYHVVVTNPPYLGNRLANQELSSFSVRHYPLSRLDTFSMFIERCLEFCVSKGQVGMITMQTWMFTSAYEEFRRNLLRISIIVTMCHLGPRAFDTISGEVVQTTAFCLSKGRTPGNTGLFFDLRASNGESGKSEAFKSFLQSPETIIRREAEHFLSLPGCQIGYWLGASWIKVFALKTMASTADLKQGIATGDNGRFLRHWHEVSLNNISTSCHNRRDAEVEGKHWFPYSKGGPAIKWYGNHDYVVNWAVDGEQIRNNKDENGKLRSRPQNLDYQFREAATWSLTAGSNTVFCARYRPQGHMFDINGMSAFPRGKLNITTLLGLLNCRVSHQALQVINPTLAFQSGDIGRIPICNEIPRGTEKLSSELISSARADWDSFETSWDFCNFPLMWAGLKGQTLRQSWENWAAHCQRQIARMQELEIENNRLWIEAYGLQNELTPEVPEEEITLARPDRRKDVVVFLSYAVGCMMGRYSLDKPGLILANAGDTLENYIKKVSIPLDKLSFTPDTDGIIPVLDGEWFEEDIVARTREFLRTTFGEATLEENIRFIEESLGKDLRKYYLTDFYKDHLQAYQKRPIYWLLQSPKKGFNAIIYLHRYTRDTANRVLNRYLRDFLHKLRNRLEHLDNTMAKEDLPAREKTKLRKEADQIRKMLHEGEEYEREILLPLAQQRIALDLDDGVKVNYLKLGPALAPIPGLAAKEEDG